MQPLPVGPGRLLVGNCVYLLDTRLDPAESVGSGDYDPCADGIWQGHEIRVGAAQFRALSAPRTHSPYQRATIESLAERAGNLFSDPEARLSADQVARALGRRTADVRAWGRNIVVPLDPAARGGPSARRTATAAAWAKVLRAQGITVQLGEK